VSGRRWGGGGVGVPGLVTAVSSNVFFFRFFSRLKTQTKSYVLYFRISSG